MRFTHLWKKVIVIGIAAVLVLSLPVAGISVYAADTDIIESAIEIDASDISEDEDTCEITEDIDSNDGLYTDNTEARNQSNSEDRNENQTTEEVESVNEAEVVEDSNNIIDKSDLEAQNNVTVTDSDGEELVGASYTSGQWTYTISSFESKITAYSGNSGNVSIPSTLGGYPVTKIASEVFKGKGITGVTVPASIEYIGSDAFSNCKYLTFINYNAKNSSVDTDIYGNGPFCNAGKNSGGITVTFGSGVTNIPSRMFIATDNDIRPRIKSVNISSSIKVIGGSAFSGCNELSSISMGNSVTEIGSESFYGTAIQTLTIPASVEYIGSGAFDNCKYLETINYNARNSSINSDIYGCGPFTNAGKNSGGVTVNFGTGVTNIPNSIFCVTDANYGIQPRIKAISISSSVKKIESFAFMNTDITAISIPSSVTSIEYNAFRKCRQLTTVKIYNKNATISSYAFEGCPSNTRFYIYKNGTVDTYAKDKGFRITYLDSSKQFSDVQNPSHPYYNAIYWAANAGITNGYADGTFGINKSCTRGEMIMFLWRYARKPAPRAVSVSPFKDVSKNHSFYNAILWASQKGITKGYPDGTFGINRNVSRGECMMFLWRLKGKPSPKAVSVTPFKDVPKSHAFYNAILWGYQKKITTGYTSGQKKGTFGINENCTRGAIVTFLYRAR